MKRLTDDEIREIMEKKHKADIEGLLMMYPPKTATQVTEDTEDAESNTDH